MKASIQKIITISKSSINYWIEKDSPRRAAALSFYTIFSIGPLSVIIISLLQYATVSIDTTTLISTLSEFINSEALIIVEKNILSFQNQASHPGLIIVSSIILIISAGATIRELEQSLKQMLNPHYVYVGNLSKSISRYVIAFLGIIICAILLFFVIGIQHILQETSFLQSPIISSLSFLKPIPSIIIFTIVTLLTTSLYRYLLRKNIQHVWKGALITAFLVTIGQIGISQYLAWSDISSAFGAAGSIAVFLLWIYYSSLVFFFGVAIMHVLQRESDDKV